MLAHYSDFLVASGGASAAFIGLLFVALAIENQTVRDEGRAARRRALSSSSFNHLVNVFVVSLVGLAGQVQAFAAAIIVMALLCALNLASVLPGVVRSGSWAERGAWHKPAVLLPATSALLFLAQIAAAGAVIAHPQSLECLRLALYPLVGVFLGALARAWYLPRT